MGAKKKKENSGMGLISFVSFLVLFALGLLLLSRLAGFVYVQPNAKIVGDAFLCDVLEGKRTGFSCELTANKSQSFVSGNVELWQDGKGGRVEITHPESIHLTVYDQVRLRTTKELGF